MGPLAPDATALSSAADISVTDLLLTSAAEPDMWMSVTLCSLLHSLTPKPLFAMPDATLLHLHMYLIICCGDTILTNFDHPCNRSRTKDGWAGRFGMP